MKQKTIKLSVITILFLMLLGATNFATLLKSNIAEVYADPSWLTGWNCRIKLTVDSTKIDADLTNFPVLVKLDSSFFSFDAAKANGEDIRFTSSDGTTQLKYEIERWDRTGGKAEIWVKLPSVLDASNTDFYMYFGNPSASDAQDPTNVWDSNYQMVQHLKEALGTHQDSTSNNNDGSPQGGVTQGIEGKINSADSFDGSNDYVNVGNQPLVTTMAIEAWIKRTGTGVSTTTGSGGFSGEPILAKGRAYVDTLGQNVNYFLGVRGSDRFIGFDFEDSYNGGNHPIFSTSAIQDNQWYHIITTYDGNTLRLYVNGALDNTVVVSPARTPDTNPWAATIGSAISDEGGANTPKGFFKGIIDEARISKIVRSAAWIKASYHSGNNSLLTYGTQEILVPIYSDISYSTTHAGDSCTFRIKWKDSDGLTQAIFSTDNSGTWQDYTITLSGTECWAEKTITLTATPGQVVSYRWRASDTVANTGDTGTRTLTTTGDWQYAKRLRFNSATISEDLVNFPVMVDLSQAGSDFWSHVGTSYNDMRFVDADSLTDLYFEVESWNYAENKAIVWVKVPQIDSGSNTDFIYVYYGNPSPPESPYRKPEQVWDTNFKMVHHLAESSGTHYDSTSYNNDGSLVGGATQGAQGKIDGADTFGGVSGYINCGTQTSLTVTSMTIEAWVKRVGTGDTADTGTGGFTGEPIFTKGRAFNESIGWNVNYFLGVRTSDLRFGFDFEDNIDGTNHPIYSASPISNDQWYYLTITHDLTTLKMYINGAQSNSLSIPYTPDYNRWAATIGSSLANVPLPGTADGFFNGVIDEIRLSNKARSGEWIEAQYLSMNNQYITFGSEQAPNNPPDKPTNPIPSDNAKGVDVTASISVSVSDPNGDAMNVKFYEPGPPPPPPGDFTIVALPDTQYYSSTYPAVFDSQTQWVVDNVADMQIKFVTHEGDIVDHYGTSTEWQNADNSMTKLDDHVPWGILPGNHDYSGTDFTNYNTHFGYSRFSGETWYGGGYSSTNTNSYQLFSAGGDNYLIFHLQNDPSDSVLTWANTVIGSYSSRRVIVTTHDYLTTSGTRSTIGERIWQQFVQPHANQIFLVLCGHAVAEARRTDTVNGYNVYQLLADYQGRSNGGNGWLRLLEFRPAEDKIYVKTYSPYLDSYETDLNSEFILDYDMSFSPPSPPQLIGEVSNVPSGSVASVQWSALNYGTTYQWYTIATDEEGATRQSDTWSFTTLLLIESCDPSGNKKDEFRPGETIYVYGEGYEPNKDYTLYIVYDQITWTDGMAIPTTKLATATVHSDSNGHIPTTSVWDSLIPGKYDIVVDVTNPGFYDKGVDALDNDDIVTTAGFFVIPEYAVGTILALAVCFAGVAVYRKSKNGRRKTL